MTTSPLHPQALKLLERFARAGVVPVSQQTPAAARRSGLRLMDMLNHEAGSCAILRQLNQSSTGETASALSKLIGLDASDVADRLHSLQDSGAVLSKPGPGDEPIWSMRIGSRRRTYSAGGALDRLIRAESDDSAGDSLLDLGPNYLLTPTLDVRLYRPEGSGDRMLPIVLFVHGGGWVIGSISTYDATCRTLCERSGCAVLSLNYRLAPEHPYPAALDDTRTALSWLIDNGEALRIDLGRLAVMGDSVGGGLATVTALQSHASRLCRVALQILVYPVTDSTMSLPSYTEHADAPLLSRADMQWYYGHYAPPPGEWTASPLHAPDLSEAPPTLLITAGHDPVRDDGVAYAERLCRAGVEVVHREFEGMFHGFFNFFTALDQACEAHDLVADTLRRRFHVQ